MLYREYPPTPAPDKDYPTRIVYHRVSEDNLAITLSDPHGGSDKVETFDLRRR